MARGKGSREAQSSYTKRGSIYKGKKKGGVKKTAIAKTLNKAKTCFLSRYNNGHTQSALNPTTFAPDNTKSVCYEAIPIQITQAFQDNWAHNVLGKFEEYRIQSVQVQILFKNTNNMVHYIMDRDSRNIVVETDITNDPNGRSKMILDNNNRLTLTWKPEAGSSDYDYRKVKDLANMNTAGHADYQPPLAYIKVFQDLDDLPYVANTKGCTTLVNVSVAVRNPVTLSESVTLTSAQKTAIDTVRGALN